MSKADEFYPDDKLFVQEKPTGSRKKRNNAWKWIVVGTAALAAGAISMNAYRTLIEENALRTHQPNETRASIVPGTDFEIGLPKASGYTTTEDGGIIPDFKMNKNYDMGNINDFMLALAEANKRREKDYYKREIMLPGAEPTYGYSLFDLTDYKILSIRPARTENIPSNLPNEAREGCRFYKVEVDAGSTYQSGTREYQIWFFARKDGRFYLVDRN
ncbi:MAG: hypothetical protein JRH09_13570 [Deltaproteobacteria bacterium]|nr:hypothetical protein [Deltaproteobacteria bacterium]